MSPERSGADRREGWGPQCDRHEEFLVSITKLSTTIKIWGIVLTLAWGIGVGMVKWSAAQAIALAGRIVDMDTALQLSVADRKVIHEEIKALNARVEALEMVCQRRTAPFRMRSDP